MEKGLTKQQIISQLARSSHGDLKSYLSLTKQAAKEDPEFLAHLIAWNEKNGQIRDSKIALPVASFTIKNFPGELDENSFAHLALLDPRNLLKAYHFALDSNIKGKLRRFKRLIEVYLWAREDDPKWFERTALQHRNSMKELYALCHVEPSKLADNILFKKKYPKGSVFEVRRNFLKMTDDDVANVILKRKIPFLVVQGALGDRLKKETILFSVMEQMTPTEMQTNMGMLERLGVTKNPILRATLEEKLTKLSTSKKTTLKTTKAVEAVKDTKLKEKLRGVQEKQIQQIAVDGNWLVLGDKSGSMASCIELARQIAGTLAKMVKGEVHLVFFDTAPRHLDVTGKTYDEILALTKNIQANGGTSIGCGLDWLLKKDIEVDGIAIVSDGGENHAPTFAKVYKTYVDKFSKDIPIYFYNVYGNDTTLNSSLRIEQIDYQQFDLWGGKIDYYSLPNLVQTMRVNKYSLVDAVMDTKLLSIKDIFKFHANYWY
jgi:hypothetical protein